MISEAELEALELLVKAGKLAPQASFSEAVPQVTQYIMGLADRLQSAKKTKDTGD